MPNHSYGSILQARVKRLLEDILGYVNGDFTDLELNNFTWRWQQEDSDRPELVIETTISSLIYLTQKDSYSEKLSKEQINPILTHYLKYFLAILSDNRTVTRGSENWKFTLKLWSKEKRENLQKFDEDWEARRSNGLTQEVQDLPFSISQKYIEAYKVRYGTLKVLGMGKPVSLDSVYTKVNFRADTIRSYQSLEDLEEVFSQRETKDKEKRPGLDVANEVQYLMVLGNPGTGKTTFLRKVGLEALKEEKNGEYLHICIPVLLELRTFRSGEIDLVQEIASEFQNCGLPEYQKCTEKLLEKGRLLILLDGLDEVVRPV